MAIAKNISELRTFLSENSNQRPIYMTSGGFDPMHVGHVRCIKGTVQRARKIQRFLSQPFFVAEVFTGSPGQYVSLRDSIKAFQGIVAGDYDDLPEQAFYMVGTIEEAVEKAKSM